MKEQQPISYNACEYLEVIDNMTREETMQWKIEKKSAYSHPIVSKTFDQLQKEYPTGFISKDSFMVDVDGEEPMRRIFDKRGFEVEREFYKAGNPSVGKVTDGELLKRIKSHYDDDGYLIGVSVKKTGVGGYERVIEYEDFNPKTGARPPKLVTTVDTIPNPYDKSLTKPWWPVSYRPAVIIDFSDVPYIPPDKIRARKQSKKSLKNE